MVHTMFPNLQIDILSHFSFNQIDSGSDMSTRNLYKRSLMRKKDFKLLHGKEMYTRDKSRIICIKDENLQLQTLAKDGVFRALWREYRLISWSMELVRRIQGSFMILRERGCLL